MNKIKRFVLTALLIISVPCGFILAEEYIELKTTVTPRTTPHMKIFNFYDQPPIGYHTWDVPPGVSTIMIEAVGGGGAGGYISDSGGGGAGSYVKAIINIPAGTTKYYFKIGQGGSSIPGGSEPAQILSSVPQIALSLSLCPASLTTSTVL